MSHDPIPLLDNGYIQLIEHWGSDKRIVEAARMSTDKGFEGFAGDDCLDCGLGKLGPPEPKDCETCKGTGRRQKGDERLLGYLWRNKHATPFEMAGAVIEVKAPIVVFREWHRHRTQSYNEMSARYIPLPNENYMPTVERCLIVNEKNKQAGKVKGAKELTHEAVLEWLELLDWVYGAAQDVYAKGIEAGIPKELARLPVPVARYSRMRASANLRNLLAFMTLRSTLKGPGAQWEIRQFADALGTILNELFPRTFELFAGSDR